MRFRSLAKRYAERFCEENPLSEERVKEREAWFKVKELPGHTFWNGESGFGPHEAWPAQLDDFSYEILESHSHKKFEYSSLSLIIKEERPSILDRNYKSEAEYEQTLSALFEAAIDGMYCGKVERIAERRLYQKTKDQILFKELRQRSAAKEVVETGQLSKRITQYNQGREWYDLPINPLRVINIARQRQAVQRNMRRDL